MINANNSRLLLMIFLCIVPQLPVTLYHCILLKYSLVSHIQWLVLGKSMESAILITAIYSQSPYVVRFRCPAGAKKYF